MKLYTLIVAAIAYTVTGCVFTEAPFLVDQGVEMVDEATAPDTERNEPEAGNPGHQEEPEPTAEPERAVEEAPQEEEPAVEEEEAPVDPEEPGGYQEPEPRGERACGDFEPFELHPEGTPTHYRSGNEVRGWDPTVLVESDTGLFRAFYGNPVDGKMALFSATSRDGLTWTAVNEGRPVLRGQPGEWDAAMETSSVLQRNGVFHMWYLGYPCLIPEGQAGRHKCIGYATSEDGVSWDRRPEPVMQPELAFEQPFEKCHGGGSLEGCNEVYWDGGLQEPSVVWDDDQSVYKMWYTGTTLTRIQFERQGELQTRNVTQSKVGYATSENGVDWVRRPQPVFQWTPEQYGEESWNFPVHTNVTADPGGGYHLFYIGMYGLRHAYSADGVNWERNVNNPMVPSWGEPGRKIQLGGPSAIWQEDGEVMLFHMMSTPGSNRYGGNGMRLALATGHCGAL